MLLKETFNKHSKNEPIERLGLPIATEGDADTALQDSQSACRQMPKKYQKSGISQNRMEILHQRAVAALQQGHLF